MLCIMCSLRMRRITLAATAATLIALSAPIPSAAFAPAPRISSFKRQQQNDAIVASSPHNTGVVGPLQLSTLPTGVNQPTELPDSLTDAAAIAANVREEKQQILRCLLLCITYAHRNIFCSFLISGLPSTLGNHRHHSPMSSRLRHEHRRRDIYHTKEQH